MYDTNEVLCSISNKDFICYDSTEISDGINFEIDIEKALNLESDFSSIDDVLAYLLYYFLIDYDDLTYNEEESIYELSTEATIDMFLDYEISSLSREEIESDIEEYGIFYYFVFEEGILTEICMDYDGQEEYRGVFDYT